MLPINDLLPIDLSTSATQAVDIKSDLLPDADISATFSDIFRKPLVADHGELIDLAGDELPLSGSRLPAEIAPERLNLPLDVDPAVDTEMPVQLMPQGAPISVDADVPIDVDALPLGDDPEMPVQVVNPSPPAILVDEQARSIDYRRQRAAVDPFVRQPVQTMKSPEGILNSPDAPDYMERSAPVREFPEITRPQAQRTPLESNVVMADRITSEISTNAVVTPKVEVGEQVQKPNLPFTGIATNGVPVDTSQVRQPSPGTTGPAPLVATTIDVPVLDKTWGNALQDRVMWMTGRGVQNAEIRLNPAELGPIRIQVTVENDAAQLAFSAQHAITREAIEQAMPRLREMLSESGLSLGASTVSDGANKDVNRDQKSADATAQNDGLREEQEQDELDISTSPVREPNPSSLIDTFA